MKQEKKIKPLPAVKELIDYLVRRAKKVLKLKNADFHHVSIDLHPERGTIWVWMHGSDEIVAYAQFTLDGRCFNTNDNRLDEEK